MARIWQKKISNILAVTIFFVAAFFAGRQAAVLVSLVSNDGGETGEKKVAERDDYSKMQKFCVVVDAGHGGDDPGKVGVNGALEKDLNLAIARRLAVLLEQSDVRVVMTREDENGLYDAGTSGKKVQDMKRRIVKMEEVEPDLVVSIHQNSYEDGSVRGAQVFYYTGSTEGKTLAEIIQGRLVSKLDPENHRVAKANNSYYLLKKTSRPIVIVECGFLSNKEEAERLSTPLYQESVAWNIQMGIMEYLNTVK